MRSTCPYSSANGRKTFFSILSKKDQGHSVPVFDRCAQQTAEAAAMAASIILKHRPELKQDADFDYLNARNSVVSGCFKNTLRRTGCRI
jgi:hypothetical protein